MSPARRFGTIVAVTALLVGGAGTIGAGTASAGSAAPAASPCDARAFQNNSSAWGYLNGSYNLKARPATECSNVKKLSTGTKFYVWCVVTNYYGNVWAYGRVAGTETKGWMSGDNISYEGGSINYC
ncbi:MULTISPECIES: hypothetical protein [unclassified Streptomyces]|uniref:hypothetical protein n=1 Tax=unclassified Streptomyces TaxID=2593676 RepID=UPI00081D9B44|nr:MULTISPECIES: hypothetical protein [unclassified Streptomyces]MYR92449.1 hypothetical protein [Streptomyces sp. SID4937]SCD34029.1 hypothetical protein GA0115243_101171 [Streptomyces sp. ScaeMP-e83]